MADKFEQGRQEKLTQIKQMCIDPYGGRYEGVKPAALPGVASAELMQKVTRDKDYKGWMGEFLSR